jgi:hypothetical protein
MRHRRPALAPTATLSACAGTRPWTPARTIVVDSDQPLVELADNCGGQCAVTLASVALELVTLNRLARDRPVLLDGWGFVKHPRPRPTAIQLSRLRRVGGWAFDHLREPEFALQGRSHLRDHSRRCDGNLCVTADLLDTPWPIMECMPSSLRGRCDRSGAELRARSGRIGAALHTRAAVQREPRRVVAKCR